MREQGSGKDPRNDQAPGQDKLPWAPPRVEDLGRVEDLTQGFGGGSDLVIIGSN